MATPRNHSLAALCRKVGCTRSELEYALDTGVIPANAVTTTANGHRKISNMDAALAVMQEYLADPGRKQPESSFNFAEARARREHFAALREEARYRKELASLIETAAARRAITDSFKVITERLLQIPGRIAADLAATDDPHECERILEQAIAGALADAEEQLGKLLTFDEAESPESAE